MRRTIPSALMAVMAAVALIPAFLRSQGIGTSIRAIGAIQPRMSADGQSIAVSYQGAIWTVPSAGGSMRRLTSDVGFDSNPAWSADGKRLAYFNARELRVIDAATGSPNPRPAGLQGSGELSFHPDGKRILGNFGQPSTLCWVDLDTGTLKPGTAARTVHECVRVVPRRNPDRVRDAPGRDGGTDWTARTSGGCVEHGIGRRRGEEIAAIPLEDLRPLVGTRWAHSRQRSGRCA